ncbi:hypothetical protein EJ08DRAFT_701797 [Tothia fuscella]|uniref:Uncharacterized protein n=1 Tax=Tothia fuscella TaxID=1048955 RepID=A0A9P4TU51_9PEZI|nr:hypothetical protein EJ08DRAFT_701797 [Tothia fuscella]
MASEWNCPIKSPRTTSDASNTAPIRRAAGPSNFLPENAPDPVRRTTSSQPHCHTNTDPTTEADNARRCIDLRHRTNDFLVDMVAIATTESSPSTWKVTSESRSKLVKKAVKLFMELFEDDDDERDDVEDVLRAHFARRDDDDFQDSDVLVHMASEDDVTKASKDNVGEASDVEGEALEAVGEASETMGEASEAIGEELTENLEQESEQQLDQKLELEAESEVSLNEESDEYLPSRNLIPKTKRTTGRMAEKSGRPRVSPTGSHSAKAAEDVLQALQQQVVDLEQPLSTGRPCRHDGAGPV